MNKKNLELEKKERLSLLFLKLAEGKPKEIRTMRNNLNNRIVSFEKELKTGVALPKLSPGHMLYQLEFVDCQALLIEVRKKLQALEKSL